MYPTILLIEKYKKPFLIFYSNWFFEFIQILILGIFKYTLILYFQLFRFLYYLQSNHANLFFLNERTFFFPLNY